MAKITVNLVLQVFKDGDYYVAYSPELDFSTYAKTKNKVLSRFGERLDIFIEDALSKGTLDEQPIELRNGNQSKL